MNRQETVKIMAVLEVAYPQFYSKQSEETKLAAVELWATMFSDTDYRLVAAAVKSFIATDVKGFPPSIGIINEKVYKILHKDELTEVEAWEHVKKALGNSLYNAADEFAALPPILQAIIRTPKQLTLWAKMDEDEVETVIASNFQRSYRAKAQNAKEYEMLPSDIKAVIGSISKGISTIEESDETMNEARNRGINALERKENNA